MRCAIRPSGKARESSWRVFWRRAGRGGSSYPRIVEKRGDACKNRGDGRQATGHGFGNGNTERIFLARTDVEVGGGVSSRIFRGGRLPNTAVGLLRSAGLDQARGDGIVTYNEELCGQV